MKKILTCLLLVTLFCKYNIFAQDNMSAYSKMILFEYQNKTKNSSLLAEKEIGGLIKVADNINEKDLTALGVKIGTKAGNIWSVRLPESAIENLSRIKGIVYIDLDRFASPNLYAAKKSTGVDKVNRGEGIARKYTGKNVVVGIVDAGFEYDHPIFKDAITKESRIKKVWEQKKSGTPPAGYSYGNELNNYASMQIARSDVDTFSHGTHVAGIVSGIAVGGDTLFSGVAPDADIVLVGIRPEENEWISGGMSSMLDGFSYIFKYAESVNKPAVINLSWGGNLGAHDGTSLFNQACNNITGPGKIIAMSAGNSGYSEERMHMTNNFKGKDTAFKTFVGTNVINNVNETWLDLWADDSSNVRVMMQLYTSSKGFADSTEFINVKSDLVKTYVLKGSDGGTCTFDVAVKSKEPNGKAHIFFKIISNTTNKIVMTCKGAKGSVNLWNDIIRNYVGYEGLLTNGGYSWAKSGDSKYTVSDLCMADSVISVAAYNTTSSWNNIYGSKIDYSSSFTLGDIAYFSSLGPGFASRVKPDIAAPGAFILSGVNSYDSVHYNHATEKTFLSRKINENGKDSYFAYMAGTSMASPMTSGIIALLLEANPKLGPKDVLNILKASSIKDKYVKDETIWGMGKINAYRAILYMEGKLDVQDENTAAMQDLALIYPNPNDGSFNLDVNGLEAGEYAFILYNSVGEIVFNSIITNSGSPIKINTGEINGGEYFAVIKGAKTVKYAKIIVK